MAPSSPMQSGRGEWLLERMKAIADAGVLYQPNTVANMLALTFKELSPNPNLRPGDCSNPYSSAWTTSNFEPDTNSWYTNTSEGVMHMVRPGFAINGPAVMGDPKFHYSINAITSCTGRKEPMKYTEARIGFDYTSGYACITPSLLSKVIPAAKFVYATDGVEPYYYTGKYDDDFKTTIVFTFFAGTQCLIGARIEQSDKAGKRFLRTQSKFLQCKPEVEKEFCKSHKISSWSDGAVIDQMNDFTAERCGTLGALYQVEPKTGADPEPPPNRKFSSSPCDN